MNYSLNILKKKRVAINSNLRYNKMMLKGLTQPFFIRTYNRGIKHDEKILADLNNAIKLLTNKKQSNQ